MDTYFKTLGIEDLDTLQAISIETFTDTFEKDNTEENMADYLSNACTKEKLSQELATEGSRFYFLYADDQLAGYLKLNAGEARTEDIDPDGLEIERIYIRTGFKRRGLGTSLLNKAVETAEELGCTSIWLGVWEHNEPAKAFYKAKGFKKVGAHSFFMGDDEQTDWIMLKSLS